MGITSRDRLVSWFVYFVYFVVLFDRLALGVGLGRVV